MYDIFVEKLFFEPKWKSTTIPVFAQVPLPFLNSNAINSTKISTIRPYSAKLYLLINDELYHSFSFFFFLLTKLIYIFYIKFNTKFVQLNLHIIILSILYFTMFT